MAIGNGNISGTAGLEGVESHKTLEPHSKVEGLHFDSMIHRQ